MRVGPLTILFILATAMWLAAASDHDKNKHCGREGLCPYVKKLIPRFVKNGVHDNYDGLQLHHGREPPSLCGNLCTSDHSCPHLQKCCPTNCGYACFDPVFVADH